MSDAEKVEDERKRLNGERFQFGLEKAGIPEALRTKFAPPEKDHDAAAADIGKAWTKAVAAAVKASTDQDKTNAAGTGSPAGPSATDQGRTPGKPTNAVTMSLTARPSALRAK